MKKCTDCGQEKVIGNTGQCHECWQKMIETEDVKREFEEGTQVG